ncbi:MAG TPA: DUF459 domain-containing protein [Acidimicrobiales bacterium]|nr:DUF459 domain-containing protein [Acidimicrobiales bacterium]
MTDDPRGTLTDDRRLDEHPGAPAPRASGERRRVHWTYALGVGVLAFFFWLVLYAPTLQHNAQVSPVGTRRTVSLDLLGPIATVSRGLQLSHVESLADGALGRHAGRPGNGPIVLGPSGHLNGGAPAPRRVLAPTPTTVPTPIGDRPSAAVPLRVLIVGDSLGSDLGTALQNDLANTGVVQATLDAQIETGLTRPDYFNWPVELHNDLVVHDPQVIVIMVGANDAQDFPGPPDIAYGSSQWTATYAQRVNAFMAEATSVGAKVIWVGMPPMQNPGLSAEMATLDGIFRFQASKVPGVTYLSSTTVLGSPQGQYAPYLTVNGQSVNVREPDGTHIAPGGAELLAQSVLGVLRTRYRIVFP